MKRIISAVLTVLICVLTLCGCEKTPTVQESGSGSSFAESNEASESEDGENSVSAEVPKEVKLQEITVTSHINSNAFDGTDFSSELTFCFPEAYTITDKGDDMRAYLPNGDFLEIGWTFMYTSENPKNNADLYYYNNPEKSIGYVSHEYIQCGEYNCLRIVEKVGGFKDDPVDKYDSHWYEYFVDLNNGTICSFSFFAFQPADDESLALQESIVAAIKN